MAEKNSPVEKLSSMPEVPALSVESIDHHSGENPDHHPESNVEQIRRSVEQAAASSRDINIEQSTADQQHHQAITKDLRSKAYWRSLHRIRAHLNPTERSFSRIIHQPLIDKVSEVTSRTAARPIGLLWASITALLGSLAALIWAKRYGYGFNYSLLILLFVIGYCFGLLYEILIRLLRKVR